MLIGDEKLLRVIYDGEPDLPIDKLFESTAKRLGFILAGKGHNLKTHRRDLLFAHTIDKRPERE